MGGQSGASVTARQRHRVGVFSLDPHRCRYATLGGCEGRLHSDHPIREQALLAWQGILQQRVVRGEQLSAGQHRFAQLDPDEIVADARNGQVLCQFHNFNKVKVPVEEQINRWPERIFGFIDDFDLGALIAREFRISDPVPILRNHGRRDRSDDAFGWIR